MMALSAAQILQMLQGYQISAVLRTGIQLGVFDALASGPSDPKKVADAIEADPRGTRILLDSLTALGMLDKSNDVYRLTEPARTHLVKDSPGYLGDLSYLFAADQLWDGLKLLPGAVRKGGTVMERHAETPEHPFWEDFARYSGAMAAPASEAVANLLGSWAASRKTLDILDVACGTGLFGFTLASQQPHARVAALDWTTVLPITRGYAERLGVMDRVSFIEGDMFEVSPGGPYDVMIFSHILHHFSEQRGIELLKRYAGAARPGARIVIHEFVLDEPTGPDSLAPHLFSILMLAWTPQGEVYPASVYGRMLAEVGFGKPETHAIEGMLSRILISEHITA